MYGESSIKMFNVNYEIKNFIVNTIFFAQNLKFGENVKYLGLFVFFLIPVLGSYQESRTFSTFGINITFFRNF